MKQGSMRHKSLSVLALALFAAQGAAFGLHATEPTRTSATKSHHKISHKHRARWSPMFRPSHDSLLRQNEEIDRLALPRIQDDDELEALKVANVLVPIRASESLKIESRLDPDRRYARPWARDFVEDISQAYYRRFHVQMQLNSAVRTVKVQRKLRRHNRNAAPAEGETASSHLAGITVDLQRRGMTKEQVRFVEHYLFYLRDLGLVEPEEERRHWCFHVMVSDRYNDWRQSQTLFLVHPATETQTATTGTD